MSEQARDIDDVYHALLMEYASGCLDEAHALVVAAHMALSPAARRIIAQYEAIGGAMLDDCCPPVAMKPDALKCVMAKLETATAPASPCKGKPKLTMGNYHEVPGCLEHYMEQTVWKQTPQGFQTLHIRTTCARSTAEMVRVHPGTTIEPHAHSRAELTLILQGGARDEQRNYGRGDLIVIGRDGITRLRADDSDGAVFFIVRPSASPLQRLLEKILPFLRR